MKLSALIKLGSKISIAFSVSTLLCFLCFMPFFMIFKKTSNTLSIFKIMIVCVAFLFGVGLYVYREKLKE